MKKSLTNRIGVWVGIGLVAGILSCLALSSMWIDMWSQFFAWLTMLYMLLGMLLAFTGIYERHPIFDFEMNRWIRGIFLGFMSHLMLVLLAYEQLTYITQTMDIRGMTSAYRALLDGIILWLIMSYAETKFTGEWKNIPLK